MQTQCPSFQYSELNFVLYQMRLLFAFIPVHCMQLF